MPEPFIFPAYHSRTNGQQPIAATGKTFGVYEWRGSGTDYLHVHHADDEAWHVLEGTILFRFQDKQVEAAAGTTVFVPAGVPHAYSVVDESTRYLIILTPRLRDLISTLHSAPREQHPDIFRNYMSEILE